MIWSYFTQIGKSIVPLDIMKDHLMTSLQDSSRKGTIEYSLLKLSLIVPEWCQIKEIENQKWFKINKTSSLFADAKHTLLNIYNQEKNVQYKY